MIALAFGIGLLLVAAILNIFHQRELKELKQVYADEVNGLHDLLKIEQERIELIETRLRNEILSLEDAVEEFKRDRDPDSMFPNMEGSIREANTISNMRQLQRLVKDIFGEKK